LLSPDQAFPQPNSPDSRTASPITRYRRKRLAEIIQRCLPGLRFLETVIHPRWHTALGPSRRIAGVVIIVLGASLVASPIPFSNVVPALVVALISIAYLEEDGLLLSIALIAALIVLATAVMSVWEIIAGGAKWIVGPW
jgi:hypothetical protein